ncbi:MAG: DUF1684 domain-containing protein [Actinomycetota bacterium]|nr:DUF1684 domain-containing protein [Actinomycetota bacterium]
MNDLRTTVELLDWKRRVFALYAEIRACPPREGWQLWRRTRDALFRTHPQSPIPEAQRCSFDGISLYEYDPAFRVEATLEPTTPESYDVPTSGDEQLAFSRVGRASFDIEGTPHELELYWLSTYGGGLFLPFRDATSGTETYGAGRYLLDTVKGADLGMSGERLVLDFNFAYNPSCSYDPRWVCPLAPPANALDLDVRAGEKITT